jgi:NTE family protein
MWFRRNGHSQEPALVLSGGGAMGALQAGMLQVLSRRGFMPSRIVGTSVGALNGAFLAFHPGQTGADMLADVWRGLERERYMKANPVRIALRIAARKRYLFRSDFLQELVATHSVVDDFSATEVPLFITATNLDTGRKHVFSEGSVSQAVLASTAIPGVFDPVAVNGHSFIDGGVTSNLDLTTAVALGAKKVLAIDLSHCFEQPQPANVMDVITRTVDIVMRERVDHDIEHLSARADIALLQPRIARGPAIGDLSHVGELLEQGRAFGERVVDECFDAKGRLRPGAYTDEVLMPVGEPVPA